MDRSFERTLGADGLDLDALRKKIATERDRRVRPDSAEQYVKVTADFSHYEDDPYVEFVEREPVSDPVDVTIVGAGFGGLLAGARLREQGIDRIRLIERGGDVGGVWYWNRYPGVQCDVESYVYLPLLEELGYMPSLKYAYGQEIFTHAQNIARHFDLYRDALLQTAVISAVWDEHDSLWRVTTDRGDEFQSRSVIVANGPLQRPKLPGIPGINDFKGHTFHTSRWDYSYTGGDANGGLEGLKGKKVGIVGTGATAVQVVPHLADWAEQVYVFQRTPSVVGPRNNRPTDPGWFETLKPGWQRARMANFTEVISGVEPDVDLVDDSWTEFQRCITKTAVERVARRVGRPLDAAEAALALEVSDLVKGQQMRDRISSIVTDRETAEQLMPWYYLYCKRPCFHDGYLPAFNRPNVKLVDTGGYGIERLGQDAAIVDGTEFPLDCLIFASGFEVNTSFDSQTGFDPVGVRAQPLSAKWANGPRSLHGMTVHGFPNLYFMGIVQNATSLNITHMLDEQARHISYIIGAARSRGASIVHATAAAEEDWLNEMSAFVTDAELERWARCTPGYYQGEGDLNNPFTFLKRKYGGGPVRFFELLREWRDEDELPGLDLINPSNLASEMVDAELHAMSD